MLKQWPCREVPSMSTTIYISCSLATPMSSCWESCTVERDGCINLRQVIIRSEGNQRESVLSSHWNCWVAVGHAGWAPGKPHQLWERQDKQVSFTSKTEIYADTPCAPPMKRLLNMPTAQDPILWRPWIWSPTLEVRIKMLSAAHSQKSRIPVHQYGNPK